MLYKPEKEGLTFQQFTSLLKKLPDMPIFYIGTDKYKLKYINDRVLINQVQTRIQQINEYLKSKVPNYYAVYDKADHDKLIYAYVSIHSGSATIEYYISLPYGVTPKQRLFKIYNEIVSSLTSSSVALYYDEYTEEVLDLKRIIEVCHEHTGITKGIIVQENAANIF